MVALIKAVGAEAALMLAEIHAEAFTPDEAWGENAIALMLGLRGHFGLLAIKADQPLGFALGRAQAGEAEILTIAVRPGVRRQGIGRLLLRALMAESAQRGAAKLFLEAAEPNAIALALYTSSGARQVGRRPRYYADGTAALILRIDLADRVKI